MCITYLIAFHSCWLGAMSSLHALQSLYILLQWRRGMNGGWEGGREGASGNKKTFLDVKSLVHFQHETITRSGKNVLFKFWHTCTEIHIHVTRRVHYVFGNKAWGEQKNVVIRGKPPQTELINPPSLPFSVFRSLSLFHTDTHIPLKWLKIIQRKLWSFWLCLEQM